MDTRVGTRAEWLAARVELLEQEKELTRRSDELAQRRRDLPWVRLEEEYEFETNAGTKTLSELFDGRSQLLVYHFMHGPNTPEGCVGCTFAADQFDGAVAAYDRGTEVLNPTWQLLDRSPKGRAESGDWMRRHDEYERGGRDDQAQGGHPRRMVGGPQGTAGTREGAHPPQR